MGYKKYTNEEKEYIIKSFNEGKNSIEIAKELNKTPNGIRHYANTVGLNFNSNKSAANHISDADLRTLISMYEAGNSIAKIKKSGMLESDFTEKTYIKILQQNNVKIRARGNVSYPIKNEDFFENINTEEKAYLLGLMISDGYIFKEKKNIM